jgi:hypothetical protein
VRTIPSSFIELIERVFFLSRRDMHFYLIAVQSISALPSI